MVDTHRITGAAKDLAGKAQGAIGDLVGSHDDSVKGRLHEAQGSAENLYGQAKDAARHVADEVSDYAEDAYDHGKRQLHDVHERSTEWPHASLVVAGLVGFGLGLLVAKL
ncbi:CsbD family protein [Methylobacterium sp. J-068]|uniref:CsbD family protein n=1 Tax=Methylobacterium sp. J-068 TaxID=2836649 RepID=UPI001FBB58E2|nr:CsbD family protein [Methylobacterium sp. J-068]MCJ2035581.1 CsbD family protein [Methylobacterium sp. J-068]